MHTNLIDLRETGMKQWPFGSPHSRSTSTTYVSLSVRHMFGSKRAWFPHTLRPREGSIGNAMAIRPMTPNRDAHSQMGTELAVFANDAITIAMTPMSRLIATAVPLPVALCADGSVSGV